VPEKQNPKVYITRKLPDPVEARMRELFDAEFNVTDQQRSRPELLSAIKTAEVLVPTVSDIIDAELIDQAGPSLKLITNFGNGVDNIDVAAAKRKGIIVTNTANVLNEDTADMTMALILAVPRRLVEGSQVLTSGEPWQGWSPTWMLGQRIHGKKLGILGMGRIGTAVAKRAKAFGLEIHYHNRDRVDQGTHDGLNATYWADLNKMLEQIDILSVHCPSTKDTFHLLSSDRLAHMKPGSYVVNTARGEVIDEDALIRALQDEKIAGAGLDVFEHQPSLNDKLVQLAKSGKVTIIPHMGSATLESRIDMGNAVIINIRTFFDGHSPPGMVLPTSGQ
jgi:glyoxylate reductase